MNIPDWMLVLGAVATGILGVGRLTRVIVYDSFPPAVWLRMKWDEFTDGKGNPESPLSRNGWNSLLHCWWCMSFWVALGCVGWWILGGFIPWVAYAWWVFWGALAISYVSTMIVVRDEPKE